MRKVFLDDLPKWGGEKNNINWSKSVGYKVKFIYNELKGELEILEYNNKTKRVLIKYNNNTQEMDISHFRKCAIKNILNYKYDKTKPIIYKYSIGQIIKIATGDIQIISKESKKVKKGIQKRYNYKCLNDEYIGDILERNIKQDYHCPVCINRIAIKGYNDIATTHPYLVKYFTNIEDSYKYSYGSDRKVSIKCINCEYQKNMSINHLVNRGFCCPKCGDKTPYSEKFMFNVLEQLNINFEIQYKLSENINKRYDFYFKLNDKKYIIETHGKQHYENNYSFSEKIKLEDVKENDQLKENLAKENGINNYIIIDCREQDFDYIKNNTLNSELNNIFDLNKIDWIKCHEYACSSLVKIACGLWNGDFSSMKNICKQLKICRPTAIKFLKQGNELGWCNYDAKKNMSDSCRKNGKLLGNKIEVINPENKSLGIFNSATEIDKISKDLFGIKFTQTAISAVCRGEITHHKKYKFRYV